MTDAGPANAGTEQGEEIDGGGPLIEPELTNQHALRELNKEGQWTVSGAKMGNELNNMLDGKVSTFG